ncbi:hypothetical protein PV10_08102 [Exophiala mesophila]|uniref:DUF647 domain-containing protein n=1 Tax=Exophiala mesophila TaxID=212818 RepID=A0A0D1XJN4_EXOME|nr:uncharacterized protein PV10_08102 [Exophiala mesophila]KIV88416.1 hypothetical protein PV10_08102 [Exophiala mesophila]
MDPDLEIEEIGPDGYLVAIYQVDAETGQMRSMMPQNQIQSRTTLFIRLTSPFLPLGFPDSVTADYIPYQIYDSLQAFASTIAGLLASRAVFVGMGVGSEGASLVTTMLLYIAQETMGRVATILFADRFSQRIEADVKFYRFFADIVNDTALLLDCISPSMPTAARAMTLGVSNACRALCGVAGGSSKAILSTHFAKSGNIGELNAKDGSQETVISLLGMWFGGIVVSNVHGTFETWCCLLTLLGSHLWCNWQAVNSVRLMTLNLERASILFEGIGRDQIRDPVEVGASEGVMTRYKSLNSNYAGGLRRLTIGATFGELVSCVLRTDDRHKGLENVQYLLHLFRQEEYILWIDPTTAKAVMLLREGISGQSQAKACFHFFRLMQRSPAPWTREILHGSNQDSTGLSHEPVDPLVQAERTLDQVNTQWDSLSQRLKQAGWDLDKTMLETRRGFRFRRLPHSRGKKDR